MIWKERISEGVFVTYAKSLPSDSRKRVRAMPEKIRGFSCIAAFHTIYFLVTKVEKKINFLSLYNLFFSSYNGI